MCRNRKNDESTDLEVVDLTDNANESYHDDIDQVMQNVNNIKSNLGSIAKSFFNFTSDSASDINNKAKGYSMNWLSEVDDESNEHINEIRKHFNKFFNDFEPKVDEYFPRPYQSRSSSNSGHHDQFPLQFSPWLPGRDHFPHFFGGSRKCGKTPFGFYSYKTPSIRHYHECIDKKGESVWDSHGYWRCLFPNSEVPNELLKLKNEKLGSEILTKEDFNNALTSKQSSQKDGVIDLGEKGIYFKQFTDFLNWKSIMYENVKREREKKRQELIERSKQQAQEWKGYNAPSAELTKDKSVISSSVQSNLSSNMDSNECVLNETKTEYYNDGTSCTKTITKTRPFDAKDWVNVTENVEHNNTSNGKNGWFWNSKDN